MITAELIAKTICQTGKCKECTEDCVDYRAAKRVIKVIKKQVDKLVKEEK